MAKRAGPSISVKMILTSTLLILLIVGGFGVLNWPAELVSFEPTLNVHEVWKHKVSPAFSCSPTSCSCRS